MPVFKLHKPPLDTGVWRVNGVSRVYRFKNRITADFVFSKLYSQGVDTPFSTSKETGEVATVKLAIKHLYFLPVGSVWVDGRQILPQSPPEIHSISLDASSQEVITLSTLKAVKERLSSEGSHDETFANSYVVKLPLAKAFRDCRYVIIPCAEVLRYYFGVSQRLLRLVVRGQTSQLIDWNNSHLIDGVAQLYVKKATSIVESGVMSEVLASPSFFSSFFGVHKALQIQSQNNSRLAPNSGNYLKVEVPNRSIISWQVKGVVTRLDDVSKALYVSELVRCYRDIGLNGYVRHRDVYVKDAPGSKTGDEKSGNNSRPPITGSPKTDNEESSNKPSDRRVMPTTELITKVGYTSYYNLAKKNCDYLTSKEKGLDGLPKIIDVTTQSYEDDGSHSNSVQQVDATTQQLELQNNSLLTFIDMLNALGDILQVYLLCYQVWFDYRGRSRRAAWEKLSSSLSWSSGGRRSRLF